MGAGLDPVERGRRIFARCPVGRETIHACRRMAAVVDRGGYKPWFGVEPSLPGTRVRAWGEGSVPRPSAELDKMEMGCCV